MGKKKKKWEDSQLVKATVGRPTMFRKLKWWHGKHLAIILTDAKCKWSPWKPELGKKRTKSYGVAIDRAHLDQLVDFIYVSAQTHPVAISRYSQCPAFTVNSLANNGNKKIRYRRETEDFQHLHRTHLQKWFSSSEDLRSPATSLGKLSCSTGEVKTTWTWSLKGSYYEKRTFSALQRVFQRCQHVIEHTEKEKWQLGCF